MTLVQGRGHSTQRIWASEALIGPLSYRSDQNQDYKNLLRSNKSLGGSYKALAKPFQALLHKAPKINIAQFIWKNLDQIIQSVFQVQILKKRSFGNQLKAKSLDVYCDRSHIKYNNFCQQFENYFATARVNEPN